MGLLLLEGAIKAIDSYLEANIATYLNTLDSEYADFVLDDIKTWYLGNIPSGIPEYPSVCFQGVSEEPGVHVKSRIYPKMYVNVIVFVGDNDDQLRFKKLCRYIRAITSLLFNGEASHGYKITIEAPAVPSDTLGTTPFIQAMTLPISLYPPDGEAY